MKRQNIILLILALIGIAGVWYLTGIIGFRVSDGRITAMPISHRYAITAVIALGLAFGWLAKMETDNDD